MIEMELNKIIIDEKRADQAIVLKEKNGERMLPIVIGLVEASAIKMKISGFVPPRPLTHDLLINVFSELGVSLEYVYIDRLQDNTFHAKLYIRHNGEQKIIDARPSDSVAIAVRLKSPIFADESVLNQVGNQTNE